MTEKRYKGYKYVDCYCDKHMNILVGMEMYKYLNLPLILFFSIIVLWGLFLNVIIWYKLLVLLFLFLSIIPLAYNYRYAKKTMIESGHSEECSHKIARMFMLRASLGSDFKIMKTKDDGKRVWH